MSLIEIVNSRQERALIRTRQIIDKNGVNTQSKPTMIKHVSHRSTIYAKLLKGSLRCLKCDVIYSKEC